MMTKQLTIPEKIKAVEGAIERISSTEAKGICYALFGDCRYTDGINSKVYLILNDFPELEKYVPNINDFAKRDYWFSLDETGKIQRLDILNKLLTEYKAMV